MHCIHRNASRAAAALGGADLRLGGARDRHRALVARRGAGVGHRAPPASVGRGRRHPGSDVARVRIRQSACSSTSRCSSTPATATTCAASWWGSTGTVLLDTPAPTASGCAGTTRSCGAGGLAAPLRRGVPPGTAGLGRRRRRGRSGAGRFGWDGYVATEVAEAAIRALDTGVAQEVVRCATSRRCTDDRPGDRGADGRPGRRRPVSRSSPACRWRRSARSPSRSAGRRRTSRWALPGSAGARAVLTKVGPDDFGGYVRDALAGVRSGRRVSSALPTTC